MLRKDPPFAIKSSLRNTGGVTSFLSLSSDRRLLVFLIPTIHLCFLKTLLPLRLPGPFRCFSFILPLLIPVSERFLMIPSCMSLRTSSRVMADPTLSSSSGSTQTLLTPVLRISAASRFCIFTLTFSQLVPDPLQVTVLRVFLRARLLP